MQPRNTFEGEDKVPFPVDIFDKHFVEMVHTTGRVYRRKIVPIRHAEHVTVTQSVQTILRDGTLESTVEAQPGDWIITGPEGERFVFNQEKFDGLYQADGNGGFIPKQRTVIALHNPFHLPVRIKAPWGTSEKPAYQDGTEHCFFVIALNESGELTDDRYLIGDEDLLLSNYEVAH